MPNDDDDDQSEEAVQGRAWVDLYDKLRDELLRFGTEDVAKTADSWIHDDNWGTLQHKVYIRNLYLLRPHVIEALRSLLMKFPGWEIVLAVSVPSEWDRWPDMGLIIRPNETVDGLERAFLPSEFQDIAYAHARKWTASDGP